MIPTRQTSSKVGLALSGGGYRAAAFHLGTLKKLYDMGILKKVDVISTISGGSITGACYCSRDGDFDRFYSELYIGLQSKNVIRNVLFSWLGFRFLVFILVFICSFFFLFTRWPLLFPVINVILFILLLKLQFRFFPVSKRIEEIYDQFFFNKKTLDQLPEHPQLVIGSTNLQTARLFYFSRDRMQDSTYEFLDDPVRFNSKGFPLARSVMASSCVPFAFTPVTIAKEYFEDPKDALHFHPMLVDGGVYDNQGIHKVMQHGRYNCPFVITSDAGAGSAGELRYRNTFALLVETMNVFMSRIKKEQMMRNVYDNAGTAGKEVAYFSLGWDIENCIPGFIKNLEKKQISRTVIDAHQLKADWIAEPKEYEAEITDRLRERTGYDTIYKPSEDEKRIARNVGTNLTSLSKQEVDCLIRQAGALTELQVKLYCPSLFKTS